MKPRWVWWKSRDEALGRSLASYELYGAEPVIARLRATTLGALTSITERAVLDAAVAEGCDAGRSAQILSMLSGYLAREGLELQREPPIALIEREARPAPTSLRDGLVEHRAGAWRCLLWGEKRAQQLASSSWEWQLDDGYRVELQVLPLTHADVQTLAPMRVVHGVIEAGDWGALARLERTASHAERAGPGREVTLFDAKLGMRAIALVEPWHRSARSTPIPTALPALVDELACSLAPA